MPARHRPRAGEAATERQEATPEGPSAELPWEEAEALDVEFAAQLRPTEEDTSSLDESHRSGNGITQIHLNGQGAAHALGPADTHSPLYQYLVSSQRMQRPRSEATQRLRVLRLELIVVVAIALLGGLIGGLLLISLSTEKERLLTQVARQELQAAALQAQLADLTAQRDRLVEGRHPTLNTLAMDQSLVLDAEYVRNIIFSRVGQNGEPRFEFRTLLENDSHTAVAPSISVLIFDAVGVQVGRTDLDLSGGPAHNLLLEPGEARAYHGEVTTASDSEPAYFKVIAR